MKNLYQIVNKLVIVCGPSGSGKTTIVRHLLEHNPKLQFSVSATTRLKRDFEEDGKDYHFLTVDEFKQKIKEDAFLEWEEVYKDLFYGTLKSEVIRISESGNMVIFDIDVEGGLNLQKQFKDKSLAIFVMPPSIDDLKKRLKLRKTESAESFLTRISKAELEIEQAYQFDHILVNKELDESFKIAQGLLDSYVNEKKESDTPEGE